MRVVPNLSGFDVVVPPPLEKRLTLPWDDEFSIPKRHYDANGKVYYTLKPKVFMLPNGYWRIKIDGIINAELSDTYATQQIAYEQLNKILKEKK